MKYYGNLPLKNHAHVAQVRDFAGKEKEKEIIETKIM